MGAELFILLLIVLLGFGVFVLVILAFAALLIYQVWKEMRDEIR